MEVPKAARQFPPLERNAATDFGAALLARLCACTTLASAPPFCGCAAGMAAADWRAQVRQALLRGIRQLCSECVAAGDGWMARPDLYLAAVAMLTAVLLRRSGFLVQDARVGGIEKRMQAGGGGGAGAAAAAAAGGGGGGDSDVVYDGPTWRSLETGFALLQLLVRTDAMPYKSKKTLFAADFAATLVGAFDTRDHRERQSLMVLTSASSCFFYFARD